MRYCPLSQILGNEQKEKQNYNQFYNNFQLFKNDSKDGLILLGSFNSFTNSEKSEEVLRAQILDIDRAGDFVVVVDIQYTYLVSREEIQAATKNKLQSLVFSSIYDVPSTLTECFKNYYNSLSCYSKKYDQEGKQVISNFQDFFINQSLVLKMPPIVIGNES